MNTKTITRWPGPRTQRLTQSVVWLGALLLGTVALAEPESLPMIGVARVQRENLSKEVMLQAEFRPYQEIDLHAKVAGYIKEINVDIGDRVKKGDVVATLEVPELTSDLTRAQAMAKRAKAIYREAHLNYTRLQAVSKGQPDLLAQQDLDIAEQKDAEAEANQGAAEAEVAKYQTMMDYSQIKAPFDGIITERFADTGSLIQAGLSSDTQSRPVVRLSEIDRLRLNVPVSVTYAGNVRVGDPVDILIGAGAEPVKAKITRFSHRIASETRTMETEIDVPNASLKLLPGMYVTVGLRLDPRTQALTIPLEAVSDLKHPTVYLVNSQNEIEERPVRLGLETPTRFEVLTGLKEGDRVMIGSRSLVQAGQKVQTKEIVLADLK